MNKKEEIGCSGCLIIAVTGTLATLLIFAAPYILVPFGLGLIIYAMIKAASSKNK